MCHYCINVSLKNDLIHGMIGLEPQCSILANINHLFTEKNQYLKLYCDKQLNMELCSGLSWSDQVKLVRYKITALLQCSVV